MDDAESHARFLAALRRSQPCVERVAAWLRSRGHEVAVNPISYAPTWAQFAVHSDHGDITLAGRQRIVVKHTGVLFTGRHDYPYPDVLIEKKSQYDRKRPEPHAYFLVNQPMTHVAIVLCETRPSWIVRMVRHPWLGREHETYSCPLDCVSFAAMRLPRAAPLCASIFADNEFGF
jgi:hypothetical protein